MKTSAQLKIEAKRSLEGKWQGAILLNLIPTLLKIILLIGPIILSMVIFLFGLDDVIVSRLPEGWTINFDLMDTSDIWNIGEGFISSLFLVGINWTHLDLIQNKRTQILPLEDSLRGFQKGVLANNFFLSIMTGLLVWLWSLLFVIPGIVKSYAYSQVNYLFKEKVERREPVDTMNLITESRQLMDGQKGRLFALDLSFVGWHILAVLTFGLGYIVLTPYINATKAAFYQDISAQ